MKDYDSKKIKAGSKEQKILAYLKEPGNNLTHLECWRVFKHSRLASAINKYKNHGYDFDKTREGKENYVRYQMKF